MGATEDDCPLAVAAGRQCESRYRVRDSDSWLKTTKTSASPRCCREQAAASIVQYVPMFTRTYETGEHVRGRISASGSSGRDGFRTLGPEQLLVSSRV